MAPCPPTSQSRSASLSPEYGPPVIGRRRPDPRDLLVPHHIPARVAARPRIRPGDRERDRLRYAGLIVYDRAHCWLAAPVQVAMTMRVPLAVLPPVGARHRPDCA